MITATHDRAPRLAAPAPHRDAEDAGIEPGALESDRALHELCEAWARWARTRRFFGPPPLNGSLLGRLTAKTRPGRGGGGPDADCSADLAALHLAIAAQPAAALDRRVFELHYVWRVRNIKAAARALGIGRPHWYTLLRDFRRRCHAAAGEIRLANAAAADGLAQRRDGK